MNIDRWVRFCSVFSYVSVCIAATPLGMAVSGSAIRVNGVVTQANATIFPGATLESAQLPLRVRLMNGTSLDLAPSTKGQIFEDHALLEKGSATVRSKRSYEVIALHMKVASGITGASESVSLQNGGVKVSVVGGNARVRNAMDVVVAEIAPGQNLSFTPVANPESRITGYVELRGNQLGLVDELSHVRFALTGGNIAQRVGQRVTVLGNVAAQKEGSVLVVNQVMLAKNTAPAFAPEPQAGGAAIAPKKLNIVIEEGEGAINNIQERTAREAIVRVEDENHKPVSGASVAANLPNSGASGSFSNGSQVFQGVTDANGRVTLNFTPNTATGKLKITVRATLQGLRATAVITETNSLISAAAGGTGAAATAAGAGATSAAGAIVAGVAVVAAVASTAASVAIIGESPNPGISPGR